MLHNGSAVSAVNIRFHVQGQFCVLAGDNFADVAEAKSRIGIVGASEHHRNALFFVAVFIAACTPHFLNCDGAAQQTG